MSKFLVTTHVKDDFIEKLGSTITFLKEASKELAIHPCLTSIEAKHIMGILHEKGYFDSTLFNYMCGDIATLASTESRVVKGLESHIEAEYRERFFIIDDVPFIKVKILNLNTFFAPSPKVEIYIDVLPGVSGPLAVILEALSILTDIKQKVNNPYRNIDVTPLTLTGLEGSFAWAVNSESNEDASDKLIDLLKK